LVRKIKQKSKTERFEKNMKKSINRVKNATKKPNKPKSPNKPNNSNAIRKKAGNSAQSRRTNKN